MDKKLLYLTALTCGLLICAASCIKVEGINPSATPEEIPVIIEEAFPNAQKTTIEINGNVIEVVNDSIYVLGGDIILSKEQVEILKTEQSRGAITSEFAKYWPGGIVYFTIAPNFPASYRITNAIAHWEANTSIRFLPRQSNHQDYVEFIDGGSSYENWSMLGKIGGKQNISISNNGSTGTVIHEIGHAIGLIHEHCRSDRDNYITIIYNNIKSGKIVQFQKYTDLGEAGLDIGEFDFGSIMLYHSWAFSIDENSYSRPTILKKDGSTFNAQRQGLSALDIAAVKAIYGPPYVRNTLITVREEQDIDRWLYEYRNEIRFYYDRNCTLPMAVSDNPRWIKYSYNWQDDPDSRSYNIRYTLLVPGNISSWNLGNSLIEAEIDYGYYRSFFHSWYQIDSPN